MISALGKRYEDKVICQPKVVGEVSYGVGIGSVRWGVSECLYMAYTTPNIERLSSIGFDTVETVKEI